MHQNDVIMPFKRYHIAPVWRAEKPQRGRFREFWQCDADIVGSASMQADAESISVLVDALHGVNLGRAVVHINHRKLLQALALLSGIPAEGAPTVFRAIDKLAKIGADGVRRELMKEEVSEEAANRVLELVTATGTTDALLDAAASQLADIPGGPEAVTELGDLFQFIERLGVPRNAYTLDLSLARGIDYYTGPVYEAIVEEPKVGSVAGAGRYDGLIGMFTGRDIPATGMSLGMERIIEVIREFDLLPAPHSVAEIFIACAPETIGDASHIARMLRTHGINADLSLLTHRSLGEQLRYADRRQIRFALIVGSAEVERGAFAIKNLRTGEQHVTGASLLVEDIRRLIQA
jgi:histidyl-tRNA synthetase